MGLAMITVRVDFSHAINQLDDLQKRQVPFAAKNAINKLAKKVIEDEQDEMKTVFDRPTQWTLNSLFVRQYAQKDNLTAIVDFKDGSNDDRSAQKYLQYQINGGRRRQKAIETRLIKAGLMPENHEIFPASADVLDMHGNIPKSVYLDIDAGLKAKVYFVLLKKHGRLSPGVYRRFDKGKEKQVKTRTGEIIQKRVEAIIYYVTPQQYRKKMRYRARAKVTIRQYQHTIFKQELDYALRTAR